VPRFDDSQTPDHGDRLRRDAFGLAGNVGIALGSTGPTASVALTLGALVAATSFASPLVVLACGLPMLAVAVAFRQLNRWRANCGATYAWGARAISPYFGFAVGWIILVAYVVGIVSIVLVIGPYVLSLVGVENRLAEAAVGVAAVGLVTAVAVLGARPAAWLQWALIAVEYAGIGVLAIASLWAVLHGGAHSVPFSWSWFSPRTMNGSSGFVSGLLVAVFMYAAWDSGIMLNEETRNARRSPGTSVVTSVIGLALLYAFLVFALQGAVPTRDLEASDNALAHIAQVISGTALGRYMVLAVALSAIGSALAGIVATARLVFAMGADGVLPAALARTHPSFRTPVLGTIAVAAVVAIGVVLDVLGSASVQDSFSAVVSVDGVLFALYYAMTGLAAAVYYRGQAARGLREAALFVALPLAGSAFLLYIAWASVPTLGGWAGRDMVALYALLAVGAAVLLAARTRAASDYFTRPAEAFRPGG
jgi:amino acid transporter